MKQHLQHFEHIAFNTAHNNCPRCNADRERRFISTTPFKYAHVHEYLSWAQPRVQAIRDGNNTVDARIWSRDFLKAMNRRISSHNAQPWRKMNDSYLERLRGMKHVTDAGYLRAFADRGASCLDTN